MAAYVYIDVSQKQEYIYKNSRLSDNLYNSFIIKAVTEKLMKNNGNSEEKKFINLIKTITLQDYLDSHHTSDKNSKLYEFIYSGGGNSIIRFNSKEDAMKFIKGYSLGILKDYPDLELYISLVDEEEAAIKKSNNKEMSIRKHLLVKCDALKDKRKTQFKRWSYGVEDIGEEGEIVNNALVENKDIDFKKNAREFLYNKFKVSLEGIATLTTELKNYKKENEGKSYIGVISIDGNKMGEMVEKVNNFEELRELSEKINQIYFEAIIRALREYHQQINNKPLLYTPILQAGDDICLILEAEHAIKVAAEIIKNIEVISKDKANKVYFEKLVDSGYLSACGGVAIARNTYPFFELIKMAESLCHHTKEKIHIEKAVLNICQQNSFLNWEIVESQVTKKIEYESYVKYRDNNENYHIKPLCIDQYRPLENGIFSFDAFMKTIRQIQAEISNTESKLSNSFLEQLKKQIYGGIETYKLFIDMSLQKEVIRQISDNVFKGGVDEYMIKIENFKDRKEEIQYILNDVIEALPFITQKEGSFNDTEKNLSD